MKGGPFLCRRATILPRTGEKINRQKRAGAVPCTGPETSKAFYGYTCGNHIRLFRTGIYATMSAIPIRRVPSGASSFYMGSGVRISRKGELHADHVHRLYHDPRLHPPLCGGKRLVYHKLLRSREYCGPERGLCPLGSYGRDLFLRLFKKDLPPHAGKARGNLAGASGPGAPGLCRHHALSAGNVPLKGLPSHRLRLSGRRMSDPLRIPYGPEALPEGSQGIQAVSLGDRNHRGRLCLSFYPGRDRQQRPGDLLYGLHDLDGLWAL